MSFWNARCCAIFLLLYSRALFSNSLSSSSVRFSAICSFDIRGTVPNSMSLYRSTAAFICGFTSAFGAPVGFFFTGCFFFAPLAMCRTCVELHEPDATVAHAMGSRHGVAAPRSDTHRDATLRNIVVTSLAEGITRV